jgi:murein DD-endopeptidase MepM/ murein hydrolase activator NlpD
MNRQFTLTSLAAIAMLIAGSAQAAELAVNFHPAGSVWSYPIESARSLNGVLVQNTAVINRGSTPATVSAIEIETLRDGEVTTTVRLSAARLDTMAKQVAALAQSGMMQALDFQFAPDKLLGKDTPVSASRTLMPGAALVLPHQYLAYRGPAERLRVTVHIVDTADRATGELAIRNGQAPGAFRFPLQGRWFVGAGATPHSHHRWVVAEEFALDIVRIGEGGKTFLGDGTRMQDYHAYGAAVLASADGEVVKVLDGQPDNVTMLRRAGEPLADYQQRLRAGQDELMAAGADAITGNHIVLKHADGIYSAYAHLKPGSLKVAVGARVTAGQPIAELGGSGNSTEPHLHFHLCDGVEALHCSGMPVAFDNIELPFSDGPRNLQTGDIVEAQ